MRAQSLRRWRIVHTWSSLVSTLFLLMLCITGLPLVFHDEIEQALTEERTYAPLPAGTPRRSLDELVAKARQIYPGMVGVDAGLSHPREFAIRLAPDWEKAAADRTAIRGLVFDAYTGAILHRTDPTTLSSQRVHWLGIVLGVIYDLHTDLFAELPGELFLGTMGVLFVAALVSGVILYGPFTRRLDFGEVRNGRSRRLRWLDLHNLLGIVTLAWALVVGLTGIINELSSPMTALWERTDVASAIAPWKGKPTPKQGELYSLQGTVETVRQALPGMTVNAVRFPGGPAGNTHHYLIFTKGATPLTERLRSPVLVDARTGELTAIVDMPWYIRALELSRPLHFGDYGGLPLKIIWALLDVATIIVLGTGLYLWLARHRRGGGDRTELAEPSL
ncbi:MAG: PepSY-associated TM helix domain-containing protein [Novosphingobium sp.]